MTRRKPKPRTAATEAELKKKLQVPRSDEDIWLDAGLYDELLTAEDPERQLGEEEIFAASRPEESKERASRESNDARVMPQSRGVGESLLLSLTGSRCLPSSLKKRTHRSILAM